MAKHAPTGPDGIVIGETPPYPALHHWQTEDIERFRRRAKAAIEFSGLTYKQIGKAMGCTDDIEARNKISYLLNYSPNPGIIDVLRFCNAVKVPIERLLFDIFEESPTNSEKEQE